MKTQEDWYTIQAMIEHGGSFVKAMGEMARHADPIQFPRIRLTWPGYWAKYERIGRRMREEREPNRDLHMLSTPAS